ncbi:MAG: InlB B-repeat-containing protein, partial [Spirochaetaceae bacterium]|nr:InlB B-repeat-containing protein [Spirochaetaceae bacterium]
MKAKTRITKKTLGWIAAAVLLAGMISACEEATGSLEDTKPKKENNGGRYTVSTSITPEGGGTVMASPSNNVVEGTTVSLVISPAEHYRFVGLTVTGWTGIMTGSGPAYTFTMPEADVTVSAGFTGIQYTVKYDINDSTSGSAPGQTTHTYGEALILASSDGFSREGYNFVGWNTEAGGGGTSYEAGAPVPELSSIEGDKVTLYAQWLDANQRMITFNSHGGTDVTSITEPTGAQVQKPADPTRDGYTFYGWFNEAEGGADYTWPHILNSSVTMHAQWTAIQYSITYNLNEGTNADGNPATYTIESAVTLAAPSRAGYNFAGWYDNSGFAGNAVASIPAGSMENKTFYAKWTAVAASGAIPINNPASVSPSGWTFASPTVTITTTG